MTNKSEMFKGLTATDIHPTFRTDIASFVTLPLEKATALAQVLIDESRSQAATSAASLSKTISQKLDIPTTQSASLGRAGRSFAIRLGRNDDDPNLIVDDLVEMQVVPPTGRDALLRFLSALREQRNELSNRNIRQQTILGGGYHLASISVFTDFRLTFDKYSLSDINLESYQPIVTGLVPVVTLELEMHSKGEKEKTITLRLPEPDLVRIEEMIKVARLQLNAAKKRLSAGGQ